MGLVQMVKIVCPNQNQSECRYNENENEVRQIDPSFPPNEFDYKNNPEGGQKRNTDILEVDPK